MKKSLLLVSLLLWLTSPLLAQKYMTRTGHISFLSKAPIEDIEAHNRQVTSILNTEDGNLVFSMLMNSFQFEKELMQEHFNEKYVESEKYPKATFKGKITQLDEVDFTKEGTYPVVVAGSISIHGVSKDISTPGTLKIAAGSIEATAEFALKVADFEIEIPSVVRENIAESVNVFVNMKYEPLNKAGK